MQPSVSLIVLNWNARPFLEACLASLQGQTYPHFDLILVDNASSDDSVAFVQERFPEVAILAGGQNRGFAGGMNVALRRLKSEIAVLLNPDVIVPAGWLQQLVNAMQGDARIGVAGCKLVYEDDQTIQHAGGYIRPPQAMPGHYRLGERDEGADEKETIAEVEYVIGAALAVRRAVLERVGLFDEGFFLYFEDVDFCRRVRQAGYRVVYVPQARLIHLESVLTEKGSFSYLRHMHTGRWRFLLKHYAPAFLLAETAVAEAAWLEQCGPAQQRAAAWAYLTAMKQWPAICAARLRDGDTAVGEKDEAAVHQALQLLLQQAWGAASPGPPSAGPLLAASRIRERPFVSRLPLIGPVVAAFRSAWNRVATRAYVRPLLAQQNEFNQLVARQLQQYERALARQAGRPAAVGQQLAARAATPSKIPAALDQLQGELASAYRRLQALEQRLALLEERPDHEL